MDWQLKPGQMIRRVDLHKLYGRSGQERAALVAEKVDGAGRHVRQIELCARYCDIVIERERKRGLEISDGIDE